MMPPPLVLEQFQLDSSNRIQSLGSAGGFSGARFWKLSIGNRLYCLRRWPPQHPEFAQLSWIHRVIEFAGNRGCSYLAVPIRDRLGSTVVRHASSLWEVSPWMPGVADFLQHPNEARTVNMFQSLARFHQTTAQFSLDFRPSANLLSRIDQLDDLGFTIHQIENAARSLAKIPTLDDGHERLDRFRRLVVAQASRLADPLRKNLLKYGDTLFPVQPIFRDVRHDHVLFRNDEVTGIVDYGAMQMDNVGLDVSRLLEVTSGVDRHFATAAINAYTGIRALSEAENAIIPLLDQSGILLGGIHWLKWILLERREFENWNAVLNRIEFLGTRLEKCGR